MKIPQRVDRRKGFAKVEAVASKDKARPSLVEPYYRDGHLYATDSYVCVRIPVTNTENDTEGPVPTEALKLARKNKLDEMQAIHLNTSAEVQTLDLGTVNVPRGVEGNPFPAIDNLINEDAEGVTFGVDVQLLLAAAEALGSDLIEVTVQGEVTGTSAEDTFRVKNRAPYIVRPKNKTDARIALVMPYI